MSNHSHSPIPFFLIPAGLFINAFPLFVFNIYPPSFNWFAIVIPGNFLLLWAADRWENKIGRQHQKSS